MKKFVSFGLMMLPLVLVATNANARPYPDQLGICYFFSGDKLKQKKPCVIATGYGAGSMYTSLEVGKKEYTFTTNTMIENEETTYNDKPVYVYSRLMGFYRELSDDDVKSGVYEYSDLLPCYRTQDKKLDICYSSND